MPVLVTAAENPLARRVAARLLEEGGEVRAYTSGGAPGLRAAGAFVANGDDDDEARLEAALADVHTLVHVGGGVFDRPDTIVRAATVAARAAANAGVRRVVMLSLPGADRHADDEVRRAKAVAEEALTAVAAPTVIIRVGLVDTPRLRDGLLTAGLGPEALERRIAPVRPMDVVELIVAFDRARSQSQDGRLMVSASGPRWSTVADYLDRVEGAAPSRVGRRLPDPASIQRLVDVLAGEWDDASPGILDGWDFTKIAPGVPASGGDPFD